VSAALEVMEAAQELEQLWARAAALEAGRAQLEVTLSQAQDERQAALDFAESASAELVRVQSEAVAAEAAALVPASEPTAAEDGAAEDEETAELAALWAELAAAWEQAEEAAAAAQWREEISTARHVAELGRVRGEVEGKLREALRVELAAVQAPGGAAAVEAVSAAEAEARLARAEAEAAATERTETLQRVERPL
jgi:hypothetical protein